MTPTPAPASAPQEEHAADAVSAQSSDISVTSIERRSSSRKASRGDKFRLSSAVISNIVEASDLLLLLLSGVAARSLLSPVQQAHSGGVLFLATIAGSAVTAAFLARSQSYSVQSLGSLNRQMPLLAFPLLLGCGSTMVCLFLSENSNRMLREAHRRFSLFPSQRNLLKRFQPNHNFEQ